MRISLVGQTYFREDNGQAVFTVRLARGLARDGHQVLAIMPSPDSRKGKKIDGEVTVWQTGTVHLPHNANVSPGVGKSVEQALLDWDPEIIHLQDHYFLSSAAFRHAQKQHIPVVATNHFLPDNITDNIRLPRSFQRLANRLLWKHMLRIYNRVDAVTTPTRTGVEILHDQELRPPAQNISCGIDTTHFHPPTAEERQAGRELFHLPKDGAVFVYVGRIDREKGLDTVIQAFAALDAPDARLVLAGKGSYSATLAAECERLHINKRVLLPGFVPSKDLTALLHSADCFIMAGHAELQSIATLEAMASGLPVLAADARALPELVTNYANGFLFPPGDVQALQRVMATFLEHYDIWPSWRTESRQRALLHDHHTTVAQYLDWYGSVL